MSIETESFSFSSLLPHWQGDRRCLIQWQQNYYLEEVTFGYITRIKSLKHCEVLQKNKIRRFVLWPVRNYYSNGILWRCFIIEFQELLMFSRPIPCKIQSNGFRSITGERLVLESLNLYPPFKKLGVYCFAHVGRSVRRSVGLSVGLSVDRWFPINN